MFSRLLCCVFDWKRNCTETDQEAESVSSPVVANVEQTSDIFKLDIDKPNPVAPIIEQTGDIFKLDIDCYEEAFDYLPYRDLVQVGRTCKRLQQVAGYCFQQNYPGEMLEIYREGVYAIKMNVNHFVPFVQKIWVSTDTIYFVNEQSKFHRLKEINITDGSYNDTKMYDLITEQTLGKLEVLKMDKCYLDNKFHVIIDHCTKLKRLEIDQCITVYDWLDRKIPTLEHFKIVPRKNDYIKGIPMFLELNPNIRKFSTTSWLFCENQEEFMSFNVKLDDLAILAPKKRHNYLESLKQLYKRGFYKRLHLYIKGLPNQEQISRLAAVDGLIKLYFPRGVKWNTQNISRAFSSLKNLEEIHAGGSDIFMDVEILPNNLINLKRVHFECSTMDHIMPFIRRSVKMQRIKVNWLQTGIHFNSRTGIINLLALNREREQLPGAHKITMFVEEKIYLATKWAKKETNLGLIRVKRLESFNWDHDFEFE